jgi:hypothetical protein
VTERLTTLAAARTPRATSAWQPARHRCQGTAHRCLQVFTRAPGTGWPLRQSPASPSCRRHASCGGRRGQVVAQASEQPAAGQVRGCGRLRHHRPDPLRARRLPPCLHRDRAAHRQGRAGQRWRELSDQLEVHAAGRRRCSTPSCCRRWTTARDDTEHAVKDHNEIRETTRKVDDHEVGTDAWWEAFREAREATVDHLGEEETDVLPALPGAGRRGQARRARHALDEVPRGPRERQGAVREELDPRSTSRSTAPRRKYGRRVSLDDRAARCRVRTSRCRPPPGRGGGPSRAPAVKQPWRQSRARSGGSPGGWSPPLSRRCPWATTLRPVLNATGVVLHTNLGRAPLSRRCERRRYGAATST